MSLASYRSRLLAARNCGGHFRERRVRYCCRNVLGLLAFIHLPVGFFTWAWPRQVGYDSFWTHLEVPVRLGVWAAVMAIVEEHRARRTETPEG
jgi:hypothetical protein